MSYSFDSELNNSIKAHLIKVMLVHWKNYFRFVQEVRNKDDNIGREYISSPLLAAPDYIIITY